MKEEQRRKEREKEERLLPYAVGRVH